MDGVRFYEEFGSKARKRKGESLGTVVAVVDQAGTLEGLVRVGIGPNTVLAWRRISPKFLRNDCKRVSEARAREIYPELFKRLDTKDWAMTTFNSPYDQYKQHNGKACEIVRTVTAPDDTHDAECLPMFVIVLETGEQIDAWPEELGITTETHPELFKRLDAEG